MNGLDFMLGQVYQIIQFGHLYFQIIQARLFMDSRLIEGDGGP